MSERLKMLVAGVALMLMIGGWWVGYVQPKDKYLADVTACVLDHEWVDRAVWAACYEAQPSPGGLVAVFGL